MLGFSIYQGFHTFQNMFTHTFQMLIYIMFSKDFSKIVILLIYKIRKPPRMMTIPSFIGF